MEFFVAGGDTAEGLEAGEEVFDAVALAIEMLVKGRFFRPAGVYGYDGDAALLVHISTDGVAVVALVHDDLGAGPQVCAQERQALVEVRDIGPGKDEAQGITQRIAGEMDLRRETGLRASHRLRELTTRRTGTVGVDPHGGAVDHQVLIVPRRFTQAGVDRLP